MLGFSSFKFKYENEEDAIDHIEKHIEGKRRKNGIEFLENFVEN